MSSRPNSCIMLLDLPASSLVPKLALSYRHSPSEGSFQLFEVRDINGLEDCSTPSFHDQIMCVNFDIFFVTSWVCFCRHITAHQFGPLISESKCDGTTHARRGPCHQCNLRL